MSKATSAIGKAVEKMPVISKTQIDENLILAGNRINEYGISKIRDRMNVLIDRQSVKPRQHRRKLLVITTKIPLEELSH